MYFRVFYFVTAAFILNNQAVAQILDDIIPDHWAKVATASIGALWAGAGETQNIFFESDFERAFVARHRANALAAGALFLGIQSTLSAPMLAQVGLAFAATSDANLQGEIWDDADPRFNNYSYQYRIRNKRVAVQGKLLFDNGFWLIPWVGASLGLGFNRAEDFTNDALIFEAVSVPNFTDNTTTAFNYTLSIGAQKWFANNWQIGLGFEFADWGRSELGNSPCQSNGGSGLVTNHVYTNGLFVHVTYIS